MNILKKLPNCVVFSTITQEQDEKAWLDVRTTGIGGSDIGSICGVNEYSSPRVVYLQKTGQYKDSVHEVSEAANERMMFGHLLEPVVANEYSRRTGKKVAIAAATLAHKDYLWARANVDRLIVDDEGNPYGVLECKTAGEFMNDKWLEGEIPISYLYQLQWYLWVTGLKYGAIACLVGGNKFYHYEVWRDDDLLKDMFEKANVFWNYNVKELVEPDLEHTEADTTLVSSEYESVVKGSEKVLEDVTLNELAKTIKDCKAKIKELDKIEKAAANKIKEALGDTEIGILHDHVVKWSPRSQTRVDVEKLRSEYPDVYNECLKVSSFRVFTVK